MIPLSATSAPRPFPVWRISLLAAAAILIAVASFFFDAPVREAILEYQGKGWKKTGDFALQSAVSKNGDWPQLMLAAVLALAFAAMSKRKDWQRVIVAAMVASTLAGMLANMSRLTTGRTRPRASPKIEAGWYGPVHDGKITIGNSNYNAFPSGHTATAVGFAAPILFAKPAVGVFVFAGALWIAWSRMALGAHNLSDVVVSIFLALGVGWFVLHHLDRNGTKYRDWIVRRWHALKKE